jgi:hypothetical protein
VKITNCLHETEEEKMKKMNTMESMESTSHDLHMGKREAPMPDDMTSTEAISTAKPATMHHRKRSVSMFCFS